MKLIRDKSSICRVSRATTDRQTDRGGVGGSSEQTAGQDAVQCVFSFTGSVSHHSEPNELAETGPGKPAVHYTHIHSKVCTHTHNTE